MRALVTILLVGLGFSAVADLVYNRPYSGAPQPAPSYPYEPYYYGGARPPRSAYPYLKPIEPLDDDFFGTMPKSIPNGPGVEVLDKNFFRHSQRSREEGPRYRCSSIAGSTPGAADRKIEALVKSVCADAPSITYVAQASPWVGPNEYDGYTRVCCHEKGTGSLRRAVGRRRPVDSRRG